MNGSVFNMTKHIQRYISVNLCLIKHNNYNNKKTYSLKTHYKSPGSLGLHPITKKIIFLMQLSDFHTALQCSPAKPLSLHLSRTLKTSESLWVVRNKISSSSSPLCVIITSIRFTMQPVLSPDLGIVSLFTYWISKCMQTI